MPEDTRPEIAGTHSITAVALGLFSVLLALVLLLVPFIFDEYNRRPEPHELIRYAVYVTGGWVIVFLLWIGAPILHHLCEIRNLLTGQATALDAAETDARK